MKSVNLKQKSVLFTGVLKTFASVRWTSPFCVCDSKLAVSDTTVFPFSDGITLISVSFVSTKVPIPDKKVFKCEHNASKYE